MAKKKLFVIINAYICSIIAFEPISKLPVSKKTCYFGRCKAEKATEFVIYKFYILKV